ncbi:methyltransferase [Bacillus cereus]|nr:methyltransferase [Bacillus cereus]
MNRIDYIRQEEKKYHGLCYEQYKLFEIGSWLCKPVKTVMNLMDHFEGQNFSIPPWQILEELHPMR